MDSVEAHISVDYSDNIFGPSDPSDWWTFVFSIYSITAYTKKKLDSEAG